MSEIVWTLGTEPNPADRRHIKTAGADSEAMIDLEDGERIEILDLITGERLTLEMIECGIPGHRCAMGIVEPCTCLEARLTPHPRSEHPEHRPGTIEAIGPETPCDECGHRGDAHYNLHETPNPVWSSATCWAELVCNNCPPMRRPVSS